MIRTPIGKDNLPPEGENRQDGDTDNEAEGLQSNQFTLNSLRARRDNDKMSSQTSRSAENVPVFTSTLAIEPSKVPAVTTETTERLAEITSTASTTQGRPLTPTPVTGMEGIEKLVETETNVLLPAEAGKTATTTAKSILPPLTLSEAVAGKQFHEGIQDKLSLA
jgi:hypothetical protein